MTPTDSQRPFASHAAVAHGLLRLTLGVALLLHGLVRIRAGVGPFAAHLVTQFADKGSVLGPTLVRGFAQVLPAVEAALGGLLVLGLLSLPTLIATALWMVALVAGSCTIQDWPVVSEQLIYAVVVALLIVGLPFDRWSADRLIQRRRRPTAASA